MEEMFAIKCQNCGGPMYSHQATRSFDCAYCGTSVPWEAGGQRPADTVGIRHQPIQMVDGLMKLTHVSQLEPAKDADWYYFEPYWRNSSLLEWLFREDRGTAEELEQATHVSIRAPSAVPRLRANRPRACSSALRAAIKSARAICSSQVSSASALRWEPVRNTFLSRRFRAAFPSSKPERMPFNSCGSTPRCSPATRLKRPFKARWCLCISPSRLPICA